MPHKFNAARRHKFDKVQYRVINWAEYNESLRQRGDLTIWVSEEAQSVWSAPRRTSRGGQRRYSDLAIETCLMLRTAYHLGLRQTQGLMGSIVHAHGVGYTGTGLLHAVASRKRGEHRSGDEASRICAYPSAGRQYWPQDLRRGRMASAEA